MADCRRREPKFHGRGEISEGRSRSGGQKACPCSVLGGEKVFRKDLGLDYTVPEMFAGSILDLQPATEYEVRFEMRDPTVCAARQSRQKRHPQHAVNHRRRGAKILHVYPLGWKGPKQEPAYRGPKQAYFGSGNGDWAVLSQRKVRAGDVILVHGGLYKGDRLQYSHPLGLDFDGTYALTAKGTPERPIVIRAAGDGEVIFDGDGALNCST